MIVMYLTALLVLDDIAAHIAQPVGASLGALLVVSDGAREQEREAHDDQNGSEARPH